jgi:hypothetical protein
MKRTPPTRAVLPAKPRPGLEMVFKKISHVPNGGIICTVSYLESERPAVAPSPKQALLVRFAGVLSRIRRVIGTRISGLRAKIGV